MNLYAQMRKSQNINRKNRGSLLKEVRRKVLACASKIFNILTGDYFLEIVKYLSRFFMHGFESLPPSLYSPFLDILLASKYLLHIAHSISCLSGRLELNVDLVKL